MQVWDVSRAVEWVLAEEKLAPSEISVFGKGESGIIGLYAALHDARISRVILSDPPASHWQGPAMLNVLRVTDLAEVAGALAPRRLVSLTALPAQFESTRAIYRAENASNSFSQVASLAQAVEIAQPQQAGRSANE